MSEQAQSSAPINPYVAIVAKKARNLNKKLEKIVKADAQQKSGKAINEDQLALLTTRSSVERELADINQIKELLEEVAASEVQSRVSAPVEDDVKEVIPDLRQDVVQFKTEIEELKERLSEVNAARENLVRTYEEQLAEARQYVPTVAPVETVPDFSDFQATLQLKIHKLLKLFHVCARYPTNKLPADVNFFGKCLLGETSITGFSETLLESTRKAELYLDDELCSQYEASRGMSYKDISNLMDSLANELTSPNKRSHDEPSSPMINFFTDNGLHEDDSPLHMIPPALSLSHSDDDLISREIQEVILDEKLALIAASQLSEQVHPEVSDKKPRADNKRNVRKPRPAKGTGSDAPQTTQTPSQNPTETPTTDVQPRKPAWGGNVSNAHKPAHSDDTNNKPVTPKPRGGKGDGGRGTGNGRSTGNTSQSGPRAGGKGRGGAGRGTSGVAHKTSESGKSSSKPVVATPPVSK